MASAHYRVLIVDDAEDVRQSLRWALEEIADVIVVGEARDGASALVIAEQTQPNVVILDVVLPGLDGYTVARHLKSLSPPPRIIFLSVHSDAVVRRRALAAGGDAFVAKNEGWEPLLKQIMFRPASTDIVDGEDS